MMTQAMHQLPPQHVSAQPLWCTTVGSMILLLMHSVERERHSIVGFTHNYSQALMDTNITNYRWAVHSNESFFPVSIVYGACSLCTYIRIFCSTTIWPCSLKNV